MGVDVATSFDGMTILVADVGRMDPGLFKVFAMGAGEPIGIVSSAIGLSQMQSLVLCVQDLWASHQRPVD
uniref:Uncharacterized protein n=1 Tax=Romanomermis culicivorax TaxID=13658 RepID=A0A915HG46_ROMCU